MRRQVKPSVQGMEAREMMSGLVAGMRIHAAEAGGTSGGGQGPGGGGSSPLIDDTAAPANPREIARRAFTARFAGPVQVIPPRTIDQSRGFRIVGSGSSSQFLHGTLQMVAFAPVDRSGQIIGAATLADRNVNNGAIVVLNLQGSPQDVDRRGLPTHLTWNVSESSGGPYTDAQGSGTVNIRYQGGKALALFNGSLITSGVSNPLLAF